MRLLLPSAFSLIIAAGAYGQQPVLLLAEDFEQPSSTFVFDTGTIAPGTAAGPNRWIINNEFDGGGIYPNTTRQDSFIAGSFIGTITNSPFSRYMHIHDENAALSGVANANYNSGAASDRFAYTYRGFCTRGLTDVTIAFFFICEGSAGAYGEVWFSADFGPWQQAGAPRYSGQSKWEYITITHPAFNNVTNLRFGFRWVNNAGTPSGTISLGIDEVFLAGKEDQINRPTITIADVIPSPPDSVCLQYPFYVLIRLSQTLCAAGYRMELSDPFGSFSTPTDLGIYPLSDDRTDFFLLNSIPGTMPEGDCYRVRLIRLSYPMITSTVSPCLKVRFCQNSIQTLQPIVVTDVDTVCSLSAIDVPFYSFGVYLQGNVYTAQLSDSAGNFEYYDTVLSPITEIIPGYTIITPADTVISIDTLAHPPDTTVTIVYDTVVVPPDTVTTFDTIINTRSVYQVIGTLPSRQTYDPNLPPFQPGTVSGLLPRTPESCSYFIRIVASRPQTTGTLYGPFCIKHCDITTDSTLDLHYCISDTMGVTDTIFADIHQWDSVAVYDPSNQFVVQLLDMMFFFVVNTGGLQVTCINAVCDSLAIIIPNHIDLAALGIRPGTYYMRLIATASSTPWNVNGTLIRITIGAPADRPSAVIPDKEQYCNTEIATFVIVPYNPESQYQWLSASLNGGRPFFWPGSSLSVDFTGAPVDEYVFRVREVNYGCFGLYSEPASVIVLSEPDVSITGPTEVCKGDTFLYKVPFISQTFYSWALSWGTIIDTSNNEIIATFDSVGTARFELYAINDCGIKTGSLTVSVFSLLEVDAGKDTTICAGETVELRAESPGFERSLKTVFRTTAIPGHGNMFNLHALDEVTITGFNVNMYSGSTADFAVYYRPASYAGAENDPSAWLLIGTASGVTSSGIGNETRLPIAINVTIPAGDTYGFYITTTNGVNVPYTGNSSSNPIRSDGLLQFHKGTGNVYPFGAVSVNIEWNGRIFYRTRSGVSYAWNNGAATPQVPVTPHTTTQYEVTVKDTAGCGDRDQVMVFVNPLPPVNTGQSDTVFCLGGEIQLHAAGADVYEWSPAEGLSNPNIANPLLKPLRTTSYLLKGTDTTTGCFNYDTLRVSIEGCEVRLVVPQAFTPNGDNVNDRFTVFGEYIDRYEIRIFNRWGEQVYYSNDASELSTGSDFTKGWDGTHKGKMQDTGVYVYYIKAGKGSNPPIERKGNVTLIR